MNTRSLPPACRDAATQRPLSLLKIPVACYGRVCAESALMTNASLVVRDNATPPVPFVAIVVAQYVKRIETV